MNRLVLLVTTATLLWIGAGEALAVEDGSPLAEKAAYFHQNLLEKHWLDGLYVSIVPTAAPGVVIPHTVNEPGNVIHAGVWTGRYLGGVGYWYAVTKDSQVRMHGGEILQALRILQEVTGKPGLLARGYVKGHGPVVDWERDGRDSKEWHQGQGKYADYRWYGDVSVDNFNAVLYGYAIYYDLAADDEQKKIIKHDVDRLMTHLLKHHCRIVDVDGEVTLWGHVGIDPDPDREAYYEKQFARYRRFGFTTASALPLRQSLMLLPDLLIAHHITGKQEYLDFYNKVVEHFRENPDRQRGAGEMTPERLARINHSTEGQNYEALYNLIRYEQDPELLKIYRGWVKELWDRNWMEGNSLFTYMSLVLLPEYHAPVEPGAPRKLPENVEHATEALQLANRTLELFPINRFLRPVMNSIRDDIEIITIEGRQSRQYAKQPLPMNERPLDNEYEWKGNPYRLDGWLKPTLTGYQISCDDPLVAWFSDSSGRIYCTIDGEKTWKNMTAGLQGASVKRIKASPKRTFVLWAKTDRGVFITQDGGMSWRSTDEDIPEFPESDPTKWLPLTDTHQLRINDQRQLVRSDDGGKISELSMQGWRIPAAHSLLKTPRGVIASGPGGTYRTNDGTNWEEMKLWREDETGAADFLHAYWMGRYYGFLAN